MRDAPAQIRLQTLFEAVTYTPSAFQAAVHLSPARYRVLCAGRRSGKSTCATIEALAAALTPGRYRVVWIVAPTYDLAQKVFRELQQMLQQHFRKFLVKELWSDMHCAITNLGGGQTEIRGKSAEKPESLIGEGVDFLIIDEAARIKASVWEEALSPTLVDKKGKALLISTPKGFNFFYALYKRGQPGSDKDPDWESWQAASFVNPKLDPEEIEKERMRLPESSFRQEYLAQFAEGEGQVFRCVTECATLAWPSSNGIPPVRPTEYSRGEKYVAGLDLARTIDHTVLVIMDSKRNVVRVDRHTKLSWDVQIPKLVATLRLYNDASCYVDGTGIGASIVERLRSAGADVKPFVFTNASKNDVMQCLAALLEHRQIQLPQPRFCQFLIDELAAYSYQTSETGVVRMSAPGAGHDDGVVALALAAHACRPDAIVRARVSGGYDDDRPGEGQATSTGGIRVSSLGPEGAEFRYSLIDQIRKRY